MADIWRRLQAGRWRAAGFAGVAAFLVLAGRFWHPYYGFTRFVQLDEADARIAIPEIHEHPIFVYEGFNGYDATAYVQIAFHPLLDSPDLAPAVGNVPYRARRILGSAMAWLLAAGHPAWIAQVYSALNLAVWLGFAFVLWRALPVNDGRSWLAWAGVMFSAGALHAVRLALTDLLAAALFTAALWITERGRGRGGLALLAAAGLARETVLSGIGAWWKGPWTSARAWMGNVGRTVAVATPLLLWMTYVRWRAGPADQGFGNFAWPFAGWAMKWMETPQDFARHPNFWWLTTTTLLAVAGLSVQAAYLCRRIRLENAWWRGGIASVALMALLGWSVWEGHPGAATRVLLPMSAAFAVVAVRERAAAGWLVGGGLTVFSGVLALWHVPEDPRELAAGRFAGGAYVVRLDAGWFGVERTGSNAWAWTARAGSIRLEIAPRATEPLTVQLRLRGIAPRDLEVRAGDVVVWQGTVAEARQWIEFTAKPQHAGRLSLELRTSAAPWREGGHAGARELGFALYDVRLR